EVNVVFCPRPRISTSALFGLSRRDKSRTRALIVATCVLSRGSSSSAMRHFSMAPVRSPARSAASASPASSFSRSLWISAWHDGQLSSAGASSVPQRRQAVTALRWCADPERSVEYRLTRIAVHPPRLAQTDADNDRGQYPARSTGEHLEEWEREHLCGAGGHTGRVAQGDANVCQHEGDDLKWAPPLTVRAQLHAAPDEPSHGDRDDADLEMEYRADGVVDHGAEERAAGAKDDRPQDVRCRRARTGCYFDLRLTVAADDRLARGVVRVPHRFLADRAGGRRRSGGRCGVEL